MKTANATKFTGLLLLLLGMLGVAFLPLSEGQPPQTANEDLESLSPPIAYTKAALIGKLQPSALRECSGMATSLANPKFFWTHNDSGDQPRLFAFDFEGNHLATVGIKGAKCVDWEDMSAFTWKDKPYLVIADVGDNGHRRKKYQLYLIPDTTEPGEAFPKHLTVERTINFTYEDGPRDCESIGFDTTSNMFVLVTKAWNPYCEAFEFEMPAEDDNTPQTAKKIGRLKLAGFTGFDIAPDGQRAIGLTYADAYEFLRQPDETWSQAFRRRPRQLPLPARKQGESICYGSDGKTIYTTSEGETPPLIKITAE